MPSKQDLEFVGKMFAAVASSGPVTDVPTYRSFIDALEAPKNAPPLAEVGAYHDDVELRKGLTADVVVPKGSGPYPVLILLHGAGWVWGSAKSHRKFGMDFAHNGYLTINLNYRLAPEHPFPAGLEDSIFAVSWAAENARRWNGDGSRIALAGISCGANLAASAAIAVTIAPSGPKLKAALLLEGVYDIDALAKHHSRPETLVMLVKAYLGNNYPALLKDPRVAPLYAVEPGSLPPTCIIAGTGDEIADVESALMGSACRRAGIPYELHMVEGMPHDFLRLTQTEGGNVGQRVMFDFLKRHV